MSDEIRAAVAHAFDDEILPALSQYTAIACVSPAFDDAWAMTGEIDRAVNFLYAWACARYITNCTIEIVRLDGRTPLLFAEIAASNEIRSETTTLIYGHFDKQPPLGEWRAGLEAFRATREGDRLYGRGTADDGYATFAAFSAVELLQRQGREHGRIVVVIEGSEESGSPDLDAYVEHLASRIGDVGLVICLDSGCATYDRLWVTTSLRGILCGTLRVDVLTEGVHSGHAGGIVPSSFRICRELLSRIEDEHTGVITLPDLHAVIPAHRRDEIALIAKEMGPDVAGVFPTTPGLELAGDSVAARVEAGTWQPALEVIGAAGLPAPIDSGNVWRTSTSLRLSLRLPPTCAPDDAASALEQALTNDPPSGATVSFSVDQRAAGWDAPALDTWLATTIDNASLEYFGAPPRSLGIGGSIPFMAALGERFPAAQFLATGVLGPESNAHGPNEFLHIPTAQAITSTVIEVLTLAQ